MSLVREVNYSEVFDAQAHFRCLLDAMARPGKRVVFPPADIAPPERLGLGAAYICLALLNRDATHYFSRGSSEVEQYLRVNVGSAPAELETADFIVVDGDEDPELLSLAKIGILTYPETSASLIVQVDEASEQELIGALHLRLTGPGVKGAREVWIRGWRSSWIDALIEKNAEFPLGIDTYLSFADEAGRPCVCCLPRSTKLEQL